jgi:hypothetical protein
LIEGIESKCKDTELSLSNLGLKMTDVDEMDLTEPKHDLDEPASHTDNFYTEFLIR